MSRLLSRIVPLVAGLGVATSSNVGSAAEPAKPSCVIAQAEAPYRGSGYDHVVKLENRCEKPVTCHVSSDVRPEPVTVTVPAKGRTEVLLWRGSPARAYKARASCP